MYHKRCEYTSKVQFFLFVYKNKHPYGCNSPCRLEKFQGHALFFFFLFSASHLEESGASRISAHLRFLVTSSADEVQTESWQIHISKVMFFLTEEVMLSLNSTNHPSHQRLLLKIYIFKKEE